MLFWNILTKLIALAVISFPQKETYFEVKGLKQESFDRLSYKYKWKEDFKQKAC